MSKIYTSDELLQVVKRKGSIPTDAATFKKSDLLNILNEKMTDDLIPHLLKVHEEHLVFYQDFDINSSGIYKIPSRAIGNKLRAVSIVNSANSTCKLARVELEEILDKYHPVYNTNYFYVQNDCVVIPNGSSQGSRIRMHYYCRPSLLVENKFGAIIQTFDINTGIAVVDSIPENIEIGSLVDITLGKDPNRLLRMDLEVTNINNTTKEMTLNITIQNENSYSGLASNSIVSGDIITLQNNSIVPQVPSELHPLLAQYAVVSCLESQTDTAAIQIAMTSLQKMESNIWTIFDNRVEGSQQKIKPAHSLLNSSNSKFRRRGY